MDPDPSAAAREARRRARNERRRARGKPTWEYQELPRDLRRSGEVAAPLLGDPDQPTVNIGAELLATRAVKQRVSGDAARQRLAVSTAIFGVATALSRVLGLVRESVAGYYFGVSGGRINAFTIAFQLPNLVRALVADAALSSAFVPVFIDLLRTDKRRAWRVA
ncbi:MAG: lipid II flippase MurJ, partial [Gaiellaceae bacterium]